IAEVITHHYTQNIDLRDAKTVLSDSGTAIMGSASASGATRAKDAITKALDSPLLNDNKIRGAKNVLLLIISGTDEITIDEIGEISDHIQDEAGHNANIIMGVGEDESLESAISITVIATGFNPEQQNEISNTETKKIIHTREDEQKSDVSLFNNKTYPAPDAPEPSKTSAEAVIRHTLFDTPEKEQPKKPPFEGYVETTNFLKNLTVSFEEIGVEDPNEYPEEEINNINVDDFVIIEAKKSPVEEENPVASNSETHQEKANQQMLSFDFPVNNPKPVARTPKEPEQPKSSNSYREIEVHEPVEIIPVTETTDEGIKRYSLDDYADFEDQLTGAKPAEKIEEEIVFEKRTISEPMEKEDSSEDNPFNTPIAEILRNRTEERKRRMKDFNY